VSEMDLLLQEHTAVTRRFFFGIFPAGILALRGTPAMAGDAVSDPLLEKAVSQLEFLTPPSRVRVLGRGNPPPSQLSPEQLRAAGLVPETWFLEVVPDAESNPKPEVSRPLSRDSGTALTWQGLMKLAERHAVRYMHVCTCTNVADPFHTCLWEGVPLREAVWMAGPKANVRRAYYWGYTTPTSQRFQSSLSLDRILEDPPGGLPVILAYKMNGQEIPGSLGGPVRMIVPGVYGNRSIKWLQHIVLTNDFRANDSYADMNNDVESSLKTFARFIHAPTEVPAAQPWALTGLAQVGSAGLSQVQYRAIPEGAAPDGAEALWRPATILPPPKDWGGGVKTLPAVPLQIDPSTGKAYSWPLRYAIAHWAALVPGLQPGKYALSCRAVDANGTAQPMPRPLPKTGVNAIQSVPLAVRV
jgi:DMSO/TMAO reductase YedYZ molybdopterin-dependent catalytic subunit